MCYCSSPPQPALVSSLGAIDDEYNEVSVEGENVVVDDEEADKPVDDGPQDVEEDEYDEEFD